MCEHKDDSSLKNNNFKKFRVDQSTSKVDQSTSVYGSKGDEISR